MIEGWRNETPIMCSYKLVNASFEVWGFQTRVEDYIQRCIREVLLLGHRQAFAWIDEWVDMTIEDVRNYERQLQAETNQKLGLNNSNQETETVEEENTEENNELNATPANANVENSVNENSLEKQA